jgi:alpha-galactosidase
VSRHNGLRLLLSILTLLGLVARPLAAADRPPIVASAGAAFIAHQNGSDTWTIGSDELEVVIGFDASRVLTIQRMSNPLTARAWDIAPGPDTDVTAGGERIALAASGATTLSSSDARAGAHGVTLTFAFEHRGRGIRILRSYACYAGSPTIETWTRIEATSGSVEISDLTAWRLTMPNARVRWLGGLRGDSADNEEAGAFELADRDLEPGEQIEIGGDRRSTEQFIPFVLVDGGRDEFYGGLMWSGAWRIAIQRADDRLRVSASIPGVTTLATPSRAVDLPHAFFGLTAHSITDESGALRQFIIQGIRQGRPFQPLVTYNSWFAYGVRIDESTMVAEMDLAASLGVERFVIDAGWYVGAGETGDYDFDSGLGTWAVDTDRFPSSLASLADYAHGVGMQFGLWVEPLRVALSTVDQPGLARQAWLSTEGGEYGQPANAQVCIARPEAWQWVFNQVTALIEQVHPDYLKWDNNLWVNCDREGHGHNASDGSFQHVQALYAMLAALRTRYPQLVIENVSGGGNRIDFGLLAYTDVAWMDDRTSPSAHVRHNLEGLSFALPPAYLLSFLLDADGEPIPGNEDLPLLVRSRMPGVLGLTYRGEEIYGDAQLILADEIARYKRIRDVIAHANATLLSSQAPVDEESWDVVQEVADGGAAAVIFGFKANPADGNLVIHPRSLLGDAMYDVESFDTGFMGSVSGDVLMRDGIEFAHVTGMSRAHVIVLTAR